MRDLNPGAATLAGLLLAAGAAIEGITGIALIFASGTVVWLLFDAAIPAIGTVVARICGIALLAIASVCWVGWRGPGTASALAAMLVYNVLAAAYLALLGLQGEFVGVLLWPVILLHAAMGLLVAIAWRRNV